MKNINDLVNGFYNEGCCGVVDIADCGETIDTTKAEGIDFEDTLAGIVPEEDGVSELSDHEDEDTEGVVCKEQVVEKNGKKYLVKIEAKRI